MFNNVKILLQSDKMFSFSASFFCAGNLFQICICHLPEQTTNSRPSVCQKTGNTQQRSIGSLIICFPLLFSTRQDNSSAQDRCRHEIQSSKTHHHQSISISSCHKIEIYQFEFRLQWSTRRDNGWLCITHTPVKIRSL